MKVKSLPTDRYGDGESGFVVIHSKTALQN